MRAVTIPIDRPLTFEDLRALNPCASAEELTDAFDRLPAELRYQAWVAVQLRAELERWNEKAE